MLKYIVIREQGGTEFPLLFAAPQTHLEVATMAQTYRHGRTIVGAGFVRLAEGRVETTGRSDSLNLGPRPQDARLLEALLTATRRAAEFALPNLP